MAPASMPPSEPASEAKPRNGDGWKRGVQAVAFVAGLAGVITDYGLGMWKEHAPFMLYVMIFSIGLGVDSSALSGLVNLFGGSKK